MGLGLGWYTEKVVPSGITVFADVAEITEQQRIIRKAADGERLGLEEFLFMLSGGKLCWQRRLERHNLTD